MHGIPSRDDVLADGDLISLDFGAIVDGWHGDAAVTVAVGAGRPPTRWRCRRPAGPSLWDGIAAARVGGRLTDISHAVETSVRGAGRLRHRRPATAGTASAPRCTWTRTSSTTASRAAARSWSAGMALAIEPMITAGLAGHPELDDDWTVATADGSLAAHWEHTVALLADGLWVLTAEDGGRAELAGPGCPAQRARRLSRPADRHGPSRPAYGEPLSAGRTVMSGRRPEPRARLKCTGSPRSADQPRSAARHGHSTA